MKLVTYLQNVTESEGDYIVEVIEYFRRPSAKGSPTIHARLQILARWQGRWTDDKHGQLVTKPFPLRGPGVQWTADLLRAVGQDEVDLDPDDDLAISYAIARRPFCARLKLSAPVRKHDGTGDRRFINVVQLRQIEWGTMTDLPEHVLNRPLCTRSVCVADPRRTR